MAARKRRTFVPIQEEGERFEVEVLPPKPKETPQVESAPKGVGGSYTTDEKGNRTLVS